MDTNNLLTSIEERVDFKVSRIVLTHREHIMAARKLGQVTKKYKLLSYWEPVRIESILDDQNLMVKMCNGGLRKVHRKVCRNIKEDNYDEYKRLFYRLLED